MGLQACFVATAIWRAVLAAASLSPPPPPPKPGRWPRYTVLAALYDVYDFPAPEQQGLKLTMVGGPSPFGGNGARLLQIGVRASPFRDVQRQPAHLVLAVDIDLDPVEAEFALVIHNLGRIPAGGLPARHADRQQP